VSASGDKVFFLSDRDDGSNDIYTMGPDGSGITRLTNLAYPISFRLFFSADHNKVVFFTNNSEVYVMNSDGTNNTHLAAGFSPTISPDGSKVAFEAATGLHIINTNGTGETQLTNESTDASPLFSPDGSKIVFTSNITGGKEIFSINANGTGRTQLTDSTGYSNSNPIFTHTGSKIIFQSTRDSGNREIYSMNTDGTNQTNLTNNAAPDYMDYSVSPDDTRIAFTSDRGAPSDLYLMNIDGTGLTSVVSTATYGWGMVFSSDGSQVIFTLQNDAGDGTGVARVDIDGSNYSELIPPITGHWDEVIPGGWLTAGSPSDSASTTISASLAATISISTSGTVNISVTPAGGPRMSSGSDTAVVSTNNSSGYTLTLSDQDASTQLANGGNTIVAHSGTFASPTALVASSWGFRVDGAGGFGSGPTSSESNVNSSGYSWAGVPGVSSPVTLKTTTSPAVSDPTTIWYGVLVDTSTPSGPYSDTVSYTAIVN
jgi:Tol biopolymer transport system component